MSFDPLANLICASGSTPGQAERTAAAVRTWIVEQIDHERRDLQLTSLDASIPSSYGEGGRDALDLLQDRIEESGPVDS